MALGLIQCETNSKLTGRNLQKIYSEANDGLFRQMEGSVLHLSNEKARILFTLPENLLTQADDGMYSFTLRYKLFQNYSSRTPIDSGHHEFLNIKQEALAGLVSNFEINVASGRNHMIELTASDLNSMQKSKLYLDVLNSSKFSNQSFEVSDMRGNVLMNPVLLEADSYLIVLSEPQEMLYSRVYSRNFPMASPPFSATKNKPFDFTPDESPKLKKLSSNEYLIYITRTGIYQISNNPIGHDGAALYYFGSYFPKAKTVNDLLFPLRYITTSKEYNEIAKGDNIKKQVDNYWLKTGGNPKRARVLIQAYYSRVEASNRFFSSYTPGWKTDRGMCYLVFGPPTKVYRSTAAETWVYGEEGKYNTLTLYFTKVSNPFTINDFRLNRSASLKSPWYRAVEFWRQGRVITYQ